MRIVAYILLLAICATTQPLVTPAQRRIVESRTDFASRLGVNRSTVTEGVKPLHAAH